MSSEDYLTRYFQQLGKVLAALIGLREKKKYQQAIDEIDLLLNSWFNISDELINSMTDQELEELIFRNQSPGLEKERSVAELLYQKTIVYTQMNKKEFALKIGAKALILFRRIDTVGGIFSIEIQQRIAELDQMLKEANDV